MHIEIDTHTHTLASGHAYSSMREMAAAAKRNGLKGIAITDHAPQMPGGPHLFYFQNLKVVPEMMEGVLVLKGVELNIMDSAGTLDLDNNLLKTLDIRIASMHVPCYNGELSKEVITDTYIKVMNNPEVDIIGHPDDSRFPIDYLRLALAAKETGTLLEVNNSSLDPRSFRENGQENITTLLKACMEVGAMITVGTDAHMDVDAGINNHALKKLEEVGFPEELVANSSLDKLLLRLKKNNRL
ncbi:putative hydrolase [Lachnospiraceae bacterium PF1-21]|uniref:Phosphatase n=1 Tax=Ohessyouella blattaphilus TaxID=2949333 RepID=A0ABT1EJ63_9FIRM|nr:phosphatase [Ohessyouella blattaphilus]MCP1110737.1 phosphatase [Ohessyouella blattaphilus]MCR8564131.1 phosphatase [Ohessyouella blattaphilus]